MDDSMNSDVHENDNGTVSTLQLIDTGENVEKVERVEYDYTKIEIKTDFNLYAIVDVGLIS